MPMKCRCCLSAKREGERVSGEFSEQQDHLGEIGSVRSEAVLPKAGWLQLQCMESSLSVITVIGRHGESPAPWNAPRGRQPVCHRQKQRPVCCAAASRAYGNDGNRFCAWRGVYTESLLRQAETALFRCDGCFLYLCSIPHFWARS